MSLRLLLGMLAPGPPDQQNSSLQDSEFQNHSYANDMDSVQTLDYQSPAKFHVGLLSISLIVGLAFAGFFGYTFWMEKRPVLSYIVSLVVALVCRTFFSVLFDGVILLGSLANVGGGNTLLAFQQICINLVLAFWLTLTIYLHARVQRNFNSEPTLNLYKYGVPGAAVFFAFVWIFLLQAECPGLWWIWLEPCKQWVVNGFNLLCLFIQLALVGDTVRMTMKISLDNDSMSYLRKVAILMGVLVFIFWLHYGLLMGWVPMKNSSSYTYFFYFINGLECSMLCPILYFFNNWVQTFMYPNSRVLSTETAVNSTATSTNELLAGSAGRGIVTVDSVFTTNESGRWKASKEDGAQDVVYSNVVEPQRLKNILNLYKRLNKIPKEEVTVVEEFYDCPVKNDRRTSQRFRKSNSDESTQRLSEERCAYKTNKTAEQIQKKNAFYSSKYLILDSKGEIPKYLQTRPSLSSMSGRESPRADRMSNTSDTGSLKKEEFVRKWLSENSENASKKDSFRGEIDEERGLNRKTSCSELNAQDLSPNSEKRVSVTKKIISRLDSILWTPFSGKEDKKHLTKENKITVEESNRDFSSKYLPEPVRTGISEAGIGETDKPCDNSSSKQLPFPVDDKFREGTEAPATQIVEQNEGTPKVNFEAGHLHQYPTYSELQERRLNREKEERSQGGKNASVLSNTFSSLVGYLFRGNGNAVSQGTDAKDLNGGNTQHSGPQPEYRGMEFKPESEFELEIERKAKPVLEEPQPEEKKKSADSEIKHDGRPSEPEVQTTSLEDKRLSEKIQENVTADGAEGEGPQELEQMSKSGSSQAPTQENKKISDAEVHNKAQLPEEPGISVTETADSLKAKPQRDVGSVGTKSGESIPKNETESAVRRARPISEEEPAKKKTKTISSDDEEQEPLPREAQAVLGDKLHRVEGKVSVSAQPQREPQEKLDRETKFDKQPPREPDVPSGVTPEASALEKKHLSSTIQARENEGSLEHQSGKILMKPELEQQSSKVILPEAKLIPKEEPSRKKSISISSDSEFSIELDYNKRVRGPRFPRDANSSSTSLSKDSSEEVSTETRKDSTSSDSFSLDTYYAQLAADTRKIFESTAEKQKKSPKN